MNGHQNSYKTVSQHLSYAYGCYLLINLLFHVSGRLSALIYIYANETDIHHKNWYNIQRYFFVVIV